MDLHYITMALAGGNLVICISLFARYFRFRKNRIPGFYYCLLLISSALTFSIFSVCGYLLPEGAALNVVSAVSMSCSLFSNTSYLLVVVSLTARPDDRLLRFRKLVLFITVGMALVCITSPLHGYMIDSVTKQADGFLYNINLNSGAYVQLVYTYTLSAIACYRIVRSGTIGVIRTPALRWLLVLTALIPFVTTVCEAAIPILHNLQISVFFTWAPFALTCNLFFGYLFSSRSMAINATDNAYMVFDLRGYCVDINENCRNLFVKYVGKPNPTLAEFVGILPFEDISDFEECEIELSDSSSQSTYYRVSSFRLSNKINQYCGMGFMLREVTEYRQQVNQLNSIATEDALTGAKNRRHLYDSADAVLARAVERQETLTLFMMDIDFFKRVNDTYGHIAGDEVLAEIYKVFVTSVRSRDIVFRYGGEEFLVLCENTSLEIGIRIAERVRESVEKHMFKTSEGDLRITISIGLCAGIPEPTSTIEQFVELADQCLYRAKENGRNRVEIPLNVTLM